MRRWIAISDSLKILRNAGLDVKAVIDVGVQFDTKDLRTGFPDVPHILFEPIAEYHDAIHARYAGMDYQLIGSAVGPESGHIILENVRDDDAGIVSHVVTAHKEGVGTRKVESVALDDFIVAHPVPTPFLLKLDVDGLESAIMRGAAAAMRDASCLVVETTMMDLQERCWLASESGLKLWDIVDFNFYHGNLYQVDLVFVAQSQIAAHPLLDPYEAINRGFEPDAWYCHG